MTTYRLMVGAVAAACMVAGCQDDAPPPLLFNFHAVAEGKAYRSAQPSGHALESIFNDYGIKTVVNLRSEHPGGQ